VIACDGLLLATPEYNDGILGVFKNAIDWLSRPSPGPFGTVLAQNAWLPSLRTLRTRPWFGGRLVVPRAGHVFNEAGELVDEAVRTQLREFLRGFSSFIESSRTRQE